MPTLPISVNIWHNADPRTHPPDVTVLGNLAQGKRARPSGENSNYGGFAETRLLLLPAGTDVRSVINSPGATDVVEAPAGTGRYYEVVSVDDVSKGFPGEYRQALVVQTVAFGHWPVPMP